MESVSTSSESQVVTNVSSTQKLPGPLFKELYADMIDIEDPSQWEPVIEKQTRSFFANTTDISSLDQFKVIHRIPEKLGTAFHHLAYVKTLDSLLG
jgi:hypothetical protein